MIAPYGRRWKSKSRGTTGTPASLPVALFTYSPGGALPTVRNAYGGTPPPMVVTVLAL
ncbi:MAG: hypothetical protein HY303_03075 [Candidatus Wallbacteria bacterium]|nr:hypothetical protein [Candidatus Wallbacteria bacterium]